MRGRPRGRSRVALLAAASTALAGLLLPLGGAAQADEPTSTGDKKYDCGKAYGAISRADWTARFDITRPAVAYVNQSYPLALSESRFVVHSNETSLWPGSFNGPLTVPMNFGGTPVTFTGTASATFSFGAAATVPANGTATWTAPAAPATVPVTMQNFAWDTNRNNYTYQCNGTTTPKPYAVNSIVVKSASQLALALPAGTDVRRNESRPTDVTVSVDGGTVEGTVRVTVGEGADAQVTQTPVSSTGVTATVRVPVPTDFAEGTHPVKAEFVPGDNVHYDGSSATSSIDVVAPETTSTVVTAPAHVFSNTEGQVTVQVSADSGPPAGSVTLTVGGDPVPGSGPVDAQGRRTFTVPQLPAGDYPMSATYTPADTHRHRTSTGAGNLHVVPPSQVTTTRLTLDRTQIQTAGKVNATVVVSSAGDALPVGTLEVTVGDQVLTPPLVNGMAEFEIGQLPVGAHDVVARFTPTNAVLFTPSASTPVTLTVVPPATATSTTVTLDPAVLAPQQAGRATVRVQGGSLAPVGAVVLTVAGQRFDLTLVNGVAEVALPGLPTGEYPVIARFVPENANLFTASQSPGVPLTVRAAEPTQTELHLDRDRTGVSGPVQATARVSTATGTATGKVDFAVDGTFAASAPVAADGTAVTSLALTVPGVHQVTATFVPTGTSHAGSSSSASNVRVLDEARVTLSSPEQVDDRHPATLRATVSQTVGTPTGKVTFTVGGREMVADVTAGTATATAPVLGAGSYQVSARYEAGEVTASATPVTLVVTATSGPVVTPPTATTTTLSIARATVRHGEAVEVVARVSPEAAGWVRFNTAGTETVAPVVDGVARVRLPQLPLGAGRIVGEFQPRTPTAFAGSTGRATFTVVKVGTKVEANLRQAAKGQLQIDALVRADVAQRLTGTLTVTLAPGKKLKKKVKARTWRVAVAANGTIRLLNAKKLKKGAYKVRVSYTGSSVALGSTLVKKVKVK